MTIQEIEEFVQGELSFLDLSTKEQERYIKFIKGLDEHYQNMHKPSMNATNTLLEKLEDCTEFFKIQGFDEKTSTEFAKKIVLESKRKDWKVRLSFLRILNFEDTIITNNYENLRFNLEKAHAKKMYLVALNDQKFQTRNIIINGIEKNFEKRFNIKLAELTNRYPITQETKDVWMFVTQMNDETFKNYFGITRDELSYIYPTTKEEIAVIHKIATLSDEEILETYGITRQELLQKYPLNSDTLKAVKSIYKSSSKAIQKTFDLPKDAVLHLRTITTEMIKAAANEKGIKIRKTSSSKNDTKEKTIKKGTYSN